ncbi:hypothetical protein TWF106_004011 [Orbilia oligospora]|uniref:Uncharacterized protein n=1 Tax=Orbilia oligospora TaxID=2813651 RepID=A0A6G1LT82_ORBOL|nr:hypothetical protein TWF679_002956 [Orbilia oligospora]KAF3199136.1 hypothetical protein TWF106_004011 [Orbilia oligospora]KAF3211107.1 hypothetical protein TWF191_010984 [Orbilia oligospora]KAF3233151.1 hypothetical protein TWF192_002519 [Orbilia oligospora]
MASIASPPSARNIINNNTNTSPLIGPPSAILSSNANEDPRSLGQQEIGLISRIQEDQENTYNGDGNLFAASADDDRHWNESGNGGYKLESDGTGAHDNLSPPSSFGVQPSYNTFDSIPNGAGEDQFGTWDPQHPLTALFNPPEPDPIQRSFTAPATSFPLTLQERRLALRNSHMRATPMASSIKHDDVKGLSKAANALRNKHFTSVGRSNTVSSRLSDRTASDDDAIHQSSNRRGSSNFGTMPSIHASLRHRKTPSVEQTGYIEHLEKQISDLNAKLRSYTDPTSDKSHAAIVQRLNAKVRSLENQVNEWEALFDERIRETERINSRERSSNNSQIKLLKEQVETLTQNVANLEDDLDFEKKQNTALTLAVSDKKALAMDNAQLAQALTNALGEIAELEAQAQEREDSMMYAGGSVTGSQKAMTLGQLMIDVTPKPRSLETFADLNLPSGNTMDKQHSPFSPTDAAWQTLSPTTSNASTQDMPIRHRKMRKFPSGISAPKQLILSPSSSRRSSVEFVRGHSRNASSSWGSPRLERMGGGRNSLFEELEKMHEDGMVAAIHDETLSVIGSQAPAEVSEAEPEHHRGNSTSPTDTETSDSEDSPQSRSLPTSSSPTSPSSQPSSAKSSRLGSVGYVLFSPLRVTSAVISSIGRGVLSPRSTLRDMRQRAMEQLIEVSELEESFGSDILFGDQYDEHLRTGGEKLMQSPDLQSGGSMRSGHSIDFRDNMESITTAMTPPHKTNGTLHRRNRRRASQHTQGYITSDEEVQVVFSGSKSRNYHDAGDPITPCKTRRKSTKPDGNKPILPVKPQPNARERLQRRRTSSASHGLGIGDTRYPPPYTEFASGVKDDGWRTENSQGEISSSSDDERPGLWISQEQLRALRQDLDRGGLLKAMGISNENNMVLWTKLLIGFMATMFVALRDGPSVALERVDGTKSQATTPVKKRDVRRNIDED